MDTLCTRFNETNIILIRNKIREISDVANGDHTFCSIMQVANTETVNEGGIEDRSP